MRIKIVSCLLFFFLTGFNQSKTFTAKVVRVIDGDTIVVLNDRNEQIKIRLEGIDCPESGQDFGTQAKKATSDLCFGKQVKIDQSGIDRYGRVLGFVYTNDLCVNEELLKMGLAWHYKRYNQDENLAQLEWLARNNKIGLWGMKNPISPWDWRRM